jgi:hypothetical protein
MHKDKSGKVMASLTEVKNKTGDIFALVDEFGEVFITSYNKTRYVIKKMDITNILGEERTPSKTSTSKAKPAKVTPKRMEVIEEPEQEVKEKVAVSQPVEAKEENGVGLAKVSSIDVDKFNRYSNKEKSFISKATMPLVSN